VAGKGVVITAMACHALKLAANEHVQFVIQG
jgi:hypothetical protein